MVHLQKFHKRYAGQGLQVFVIAMHPKPDEARKLTKKLKVTYPVFDGLNSTLGKLYAFG